MIIKTIIEEIRTVITAINDVKNFFGKRRQKYASSISGKWTNEGDITGDIPSHFVDLEITVEGKDVSGVVCSHATRGRAILPNGSLVGLIRRKKIRAEVVDVSRGRLIKYGEVTIQLKKGNLVFTTQNVFGNSLPARTVLWKSEAVDAVTSTDSMHIKFPEKSSTPLTLP